MARRLCTGCKERYEAAGMKQLPAGWFHDVDCAMNYAARRQARAAKSLARKVRAKKAAEHLADKERVKPRSKWLAELQALVNQYVRLRDKAEGCISCDKPKSWRGQWHASHYHSRGRSSSLRFNLLNIWKSCSVCNSHLSGNLAEYRPRLIEKIGQQKFDDLLLLSGKTKTYDVEWIKRAKKITRKGIKRLEKRSK